MGDVTIRSISAEELPAFMSALSIAFHSDEDELEIRNESIIAEPDRYFVAMDGERIVGTAGACTTELTVPGGASVPAPGVTAVGVLPSRRRRGINTRLMATLLDQAADRGEPMIYLWASESPIYGRFGYGMASICAELEISTAHAGFVPGVAPPGRVELLPRDEALPLMRPAYDAAVPGRPGMVRMDDRFWEWLFAKRKSDESEPPFYAIHLDERGEPDGYSVYKVKHDWSHGIPANELKVDHMVCATPEAEAALWRYLFDIDLVATVKAWDRPPDESLLWILREPRHLRFTVSDGLWLRVLDVIAALEARTYAADGAVVLELHDAFRPATAGRYELVVEDGKARCARTDAEPDLEGGIDALGAAYLGGSTLRQLARAHQVRERTDGALARADAMFASDPAPWFGFIY